MEKTNIRQESSRQGVKHGLTFGTVKCSVIWKCFTHEMSVTCITWVRSTNMTNLHIYVQAKCDVSLNSVVVPQLLNCGLFHLAVLNNHFNLLP